MMYAGLFSVSRDQLQHLPVCVCRASTSSLQERGQVSRLLCSGPVLLLLLTAQSALMEIQDSIESENVGFFALLCRSRQELLNRSPYSCPSLAKRVCLSLARDQTLPDSHEDTGVPSLRPDMFMTATINSDMSPPHPQPPPYQSPLHCARPEPAPPSP